MRNEGRGVSGSRCRGAGRPCATSRLHDFATVCLILLAATRSPAQQRVASDFEIAQMEKQLATAHDFNSQLSGHLNLGDARLARNEPTLATTEYELALNVATNERLNARRDSQMARYATATAYAGLAAAKVGDGARAFSLLEEAIRYTSDSAKTWNLYSTAMGVLGKPAKAASAARNAVTIAKREGGQPLDLAIYEYALASALGDTPESEQLLRDAIATLQSPAFDALRREVARGERFEIYSSAKGDAAAYLSLLNRAQLRLGRLYETHGDATRARQVYESVLASRSDDPIALAALVRLARSDAERERAFADAFDANPFSPDLIREYRKYRHGEVEGDSTGARVRRALVALQRGESSRARAELDALTKAFPANETLRALRNDAEPQAGALPKGTNPSAAELRAAIALFAHITPEQRAALDTMTFTSAATFTADDAGTIDGVPFKLSAPVTQRVSDSLHLTYRILGATSVDGADGLLLEPLAVAP